LFYAPGSIFGSEVGVGSSFHILRSRARFGRYRWRRVQFSCFALSDSFWAISRVSGHVFTFISRTYFWRRDQFSCFALSDLFWAVATTSGADFMFCAPGSFSTILRAPVHFSCFPLRTRFGWYQGHRVAFSCFALPDSFSTVPRVLVAVFLVCAPRHNLGGIDGVRPRFHILCSRTRLGQYRWRRVRFS
jgi:hypothetical protein